MFHSSLRGSLLSDTHRPIWLQSFCLTHAHKLGLIAGNGRFPLLVLNAAKAQGFDVIVAAIKEETSPQIDGQDARVYWLSLGELSKLIDTFKREGVHRAVMAGQVKHKQIFSAIKPDWRLAKLLLSLRTRNTDALLTAIAKVLADEGIVLEESTAFLEPLLAQPGVLTRRHPSEQEKKDIEYGRMIGRALTEFDIGQTIVVAANACVAIEAMEGTDAAIERAGELMQSLDPDGAVPNQPFFSRSFLSRSFLSRSLTVVKSAKANQDMRFDIPVIGTKTIEVMRAAGARCLALSAGKCLLLDGPGVIVEVADSNGISIVAD